MMSTPMMKTRDVLCSRRLEAKRKPRPPKNGPRQRRRRAKRRRRRTLSRLLRSNPRAKVNPRPMRMPQPPVDQHNFPNGIRTPQQQTASSVDGNSQFQPPKIPNIPNPPNNLPLMPPRQPMPPNLLRNAQGAMAKAKADILARRKLSPFF